MHVWEGISASVIGTSHEERNQEKQDSVYLVTDEKGNISFCLSDGAGSSKHSKSTSSFTAEFIANELYALPGEIEKRGVGAWINDFIIQTIINLRANFYKELSTDDFRDYHCTLVAGVVFENTALIAHVGDGAVLTGSVEYSEDKAILNKNLNLSEPENGEYKNETYFVTEPFWLKHLRIKVVPKTDWLIAGTDGGIDLLSTGERLKDEILEKWIKSLVGFETQDRERRLKSEMASDNSNSKTNDDKSIVFLFSDKLNSKDLLWDKTLDTVDKFYPKPQKKTQASHQKTPNEIQNLSENDQNKVEQKYFNFLNTKFSKVMLAAIEKVAYFTRHNILALSLFLILALSLIVAYSSGKIPIFNDPQENMSEENIDGEEVNKPSLEQDEKLENEETDKPEQSKAEMNPPNDKEAVKKPIKHEKEQEKSKDMSNDEIKKNPNTETEEQELFEKNESQSSSSDPTTSNQVESMGEKADESNQEKNKKDNRLNLPQTSNVPNQ